MPNDENTRSRISSFRDAPDIGAFYFEDAAAMLSESACLVGRAEFTLPPRARFVADDLDNLPPKRFRVLRCLVSGHSDSGEPICDLVLTAEKGMPYENDEINDDERDGR